MTSRHWSASFVGIPWDERGVDRRGLACWTLVVLVFQERFGIVVPNYAEVVTSTAERAEISAIFDEAPRRWPWTPVEAGQETEMDVAVFRRGGLDAHVGLVVGPGQMLHVSSGHDSRIERYTEGRWRPRLSGFYRHARLAQYHCGGTVSQSDYPKIPVLGSYEVHPIYTVLPYNATGTDGEVLISVEFSGGST